jgi:hypothetical protein
MSAQHGTRPEEQDVSGWALGAIVFAAIIMTMIGVFQIASGLVAILNDEFFLATRNYTFDLDVTTWGWIHLIIGIALFASGMGVLSGRMIARIVGVVFVGLNALTSLIFIEAAPGWGIIMITVDVLVIYSLTVHGSELRDL